MESILEEYINRILPLYQISDREKMTWENITSLWVLTYLKTLEEIQEEEGCDSFRANIKFLSLENIIPIYISDLDESDL